MSVVSILEAKPIFGYLCVGKGDPPPSQERTGQKFGSPLLNLNWRRCCLVRLRRELLDGRPASGVRQTFCLRALAEGSGSVCCVLCRACGDLASSGWSRRLARIRSDHPVIHCGPSAVDWV